MWGFRFYAMLASAFVAGAAASAQLTPRVWDEGPVWQITWLTIKPGQMNAYAKYFRDVTVPRLEYEKRDGDILSYHLMRVNNPRDGEPNAFILIESRNMAAFDRGPAYQEERDRKLAGSAEARMAQIVQARSWFDYRGSVLSREVRFTNAR